MAGVSLRTLLVLVTLAVLKEARTSGVRQALYHRNSRMDGVQLTATALFQAPARSTGHCGIQCSQLDCCRSFTFSADQPSSCRGYDVAMTSPNANNTLPAATAKTFAVVMADWLETPCIGEADQSVKCPVQHSECFKGQWLCAPGYYYSDGSKTCLADCPLADLGAAFVKYRESGFSVPNLWHGSVTDVSECRDHCLFNVTNCRSLDYRAATRYCGVKHSTALSEPSEYFPEHSQWDHYQRTCA